MTKVDEASLEQLIEEAGVGKTTAVKLRKANAKDGDEPKEKKEATSKRTGAPSAFMGQKFSVRL